MDIISHTLTGIAIGTVIATVSKQNWKLKSTIIILGGIGGALPDLDAISLWSKFDTNIGSFLELGHTGKQIYFGKFWYSHHAIFHSLFTPIFILTLWLCISLIKRKSFNLIALKSQFIKRKYLFSSFFLGFLFHLIEDMPTPSSVWGGVNLFFPSSNYIGGYGKIWWWNNYDLVLIIISVIIINLSVNLLPKALNKLKIKLSITIFLSGLLFGLFQINTRTSDFSYTGHTAHYKQLEADSKLIQKEILGEKLYNFMTAVDNKIPLNF